MVKQTLKLVQRDEKPRGLLPSYHNCKLMLGDWAIEFASNSFLLWRCIHLRFAKLLRSPFITSVLMLKIRVSNCYIMITNDLEYLTKEVGEWSEHFHEHGSDDMMIKLLLLFRRQYTLSCCAVACCKRDRFGRDELSADVQLAARQTTGAWREIATALHAVLVEPLDSSGAGRETPVEI